MVANNTMCESGLMHYLAVNYIVASVPDIMLLNILFLYTSSLCEQFIMLYVVYVWLPKHYSTNVLNIVKLVMAESSILQMNLLRL